MSERKPLARTESRDVRLTFRVTSSYAQRLREEAAARDTELSRLVRRWIDMGRSMDAALDNRKAAGA